MNRALPRPGGRPPPRPPHRHGASLRTGAGTTVSRLSGLFRLVVAAWALGAAPTGNAFNLANSTPNIVHDLVLGGVLAASFVPVFVDRLATKTRREAENSISAVVTLSLVVLVGATVLLVLAAPAVIDLYTVGSSNAQLATERALAVQLLRYFAPQLLAYGTISLIAAVLATRDRFVAVGFVPVVNNLVGMLVLGVFGEIARSSAVASGHLSGSLVAFLGIGTTAGVMLQALCLVPLLRHCDIRLRLTWRPRDPAIAMIFRLSGWTIGFVGANQLAVFIVLALEYHLNQVSVYAYAYQFFLVPYAVVAVSVVNVATPALARSYVVGDLAALGQRYGHAARRQTLSLVLPAAVAYLMLAKPAIALVLGHGAFNNHANVADTAASLALFAVGLPAFCLYFLTIRAFQSMQDTRTAFVCYTLENGTNILMAFLLYRPLGVKGLALAYSIAYCVGAIATIAILRERLGTIGGTMILRQILRSIVLSALMAVAIAFVEALIGSGTGLFGWLRLLVTAAVGGAVYLGGAGAAASAAGWQTSRRTRP